MTLRRRTVVARRLRRDATGAEQRLWRELRELGLRHRFRRQHPIGRYIVDFACPTAKLVIELDGGQHALRAEDDQSRTNEIEGHDYRLIRFWNGDVMENLEGVLEAIRRKVEISLSAPGGGEGGGGGEVGNSACRDNPPHPPTPQAGGDGSSSDV